MNKKGNIFIGILIAIGVITVTAVATYKVFIKDNDSSDKIQTNENNDNINSNEFNDLNQVEIENNESKEENNDQEIEDELNIYENYNKIINDKLQKPLQLILENEMGYDYSQITFVRNYLNVTDNKIIFAWQLMVQDNNIIKIEDINVNNEEVTGALAIKTSDFINKYKEIYNENIFESEIIQNGYTIKDDYIYGTYVSSWGAPNFILKYKDIEYTGEGNFYVLKLDFLTKIVNNQIDNKAFLAYQDPIITDYPEDLVYKKLNIYLTKENDKYVFKYIIFDE